MPCKGFGRDSGYEVGVKEFGALSRNAAFGRSAGVMNDAFQIIALIRPKRYSPMGKFTYMPDRDGFAAMPKGTVPEKENLQGRLIDRIASLAEIIAR